jgi:recombination protein RecA
MLPELGLPRGAVTELCSPVGLARCTQLALAACASEQRSSEPVWCAWIDGSGSLYAPGVARAGVDLDHLLVVRPDPSDLVRVAVRVTASRVFSVVVIDRCGIPGAELGDVTSSRTAPSRTAPSRSAPSRTAPSNAAPKKRIRWDIAVRRLALAAKSSDCTVLLLSRTSRAHAQPLPVATRIELSRPGTDRLLVSITKDRRGRLSGPVPLPLASMSKR